MKNRMKIIYFLFALALSGMACTKIADQQPVSSFEKETGPLPWLTLSLDSNHLSQTIRFDSIAQGGNFSVQFTSLSHGKIRIVENGQSVQIQMNAGNWKADSSQYTICKSGVCRIGEIRLVNRSYKANDTIPNPLDTSCSELPLRSIYLAFEAVFQVQNIFPFGGKGTIDSIKTQFYPAQNMGDSIIRYQAGGVVLDHKTAWDTIRYQLKATNRQCWTGKIAVVIGDTCEAHARNDVFHLSSGNALWPESQLTSNDQGCNNLLGTFQTRSQYPDFDYGNYLQQNTRNGMLTDTLIGGNQHYKYQRTNPSATEDGFYYYFKNLISGRVTKAWVRIRFD